MKNKKLFIFSIIILILFVFLGLFKNNLLMMIYPRNYEDIVSNYGEKYNIDKNLIFAVIKAESNFNNNALSNKNAIGLMQIMEETAKDVALKNSIDINLNNVKEEILNADNNINIGTKYLQILLNRYDNIEVALAAYNAGIGTVDNWIEKGIIKSDGTDIEKIPYKETNTYVRKILRDYKIYKKLYS